MKDLITLLTDILIIGCILILVMVYLKIGHIRKYYRMSERSMRHRIEEMRNMSALADILDVECMEVNTKFQSVKN